MTSPHPPGSLVLTSDPSIIMLRQLDDIQAGAEIECITTDENGNFEIQWEGNTKVYWDTQSPVVDERGRRTFEGSDAKDHREDRLSVVMPDGTLHPYYKEPNDPVPDAARPTGVA